MKPLAVAGNVNVDMILGEVAPWPVPGTEIFVDHSELRVGGSAANSALTWKALGIDFQFVANTGSDLYGEWMRDLLRPHSVAWSVSEGPSTVSVGMTHPDGERTFFTNQGHLHNLKWPDVRDGLDWRALPGGWLLVCGAFLTTQLAGRLADLFQHAERYDVEIAMDTGWPPLGWTEETVATARDWMRSTSVLLVNEAEAAALSGRRDPREAGRALAPILRPGGITVVKIGPEGVLVFSRGDEIHVPAPAVRVVDTIGAGDVFNAAFLKGLAEGGTLAAAAEFGVNSASRAISTYPRSYSADQA
jgi:sugar/nucleoside kinase (ribokinase family)